MQHFASDKSYYIDTEVSSVKWNGMRLKKIILASDRIKIGKKVKKYGFMQYINPLILLKLFFGNYNNQTDREDEFEEFMFSNIKSIKLEKLKITGDKYVILDLKNGKQIKFFAVDAFNTVDSNTQEIFNLISKKLSS